MRLSTPWLYGWLLIVLLAIGVVIWGWATSRLASARGGPGHPEAEQGGVAPPQDVPTQPVRWSQAALIGIFMWGGYLLVLAALSIAPLSVVAPVRETAIVAVAVWGVWKLRERKGAALKLLGAGATLVGIALLAL